MFGDQSSGRGTGGVGGFGSIVLNAFDHVCVDGIDDEEVRCSAESLIEGGVEVVAGLDGDGDDAQDKPPFGFRRRPCDEQAPGHPQSR